MKNKDLLFLLTLLSAFAEADGANMYAKNIRSMNFVPKTNTQTMISNYLSRQNDIPTAVSDDSSVQGNPDVWNFSDYESLDGSIFYVDRTYKVACINYYNKSGSNVEIPAHVTLSSEEYTIVGIGDNYSSFLNSDSLRSVKLPETLRFIGSRSFSDCRKLESVNIPQAVEKISEYAFNNCSLLQSIVFPESLTAIGRYAFSGCSALKSIQFPTTLSLIEEYCFNACTSLEQMKFPDNCVLTEIGSNAFDQTNLNELVLPASLITIGDHIVSSDKGSGIKLTMQASVPPILSSGVGSNVYSVRVPQGAGEAYRNAEYWKNLVIVEGDGVNLNIDVDAPGSLGDKILAQTENLADVNRLTITGTLNEEDLYSIKNRLPNLVEIDLSGVNMPVMNSEMFSNRKALEKIVLPKNLREISSYVLNGCVSLETVYFSDSLRIIGNDAFNGSDKLKEIIVPEGVVEIGDRAFADCEGLEVLHLPSTLKTVSSSLASGCDKLKEILLPEGIEEIQSDAFGYDSNLTNVTLPSTLMKLASSAFYSCIGLQSIVLPEKLISCANAFAGCSNLKEVTSLALFPPYLNDESLLGGGSTDYEDRKLYVPALNINDYKLTKGWDQFPTILGINELPQNINVYKPSEFELPDTLSKNYKPNLSLLENDYVYNQDCGYGYASLKVSGNPTLSLGKFDMVYNPYSYNNKYAANSPCYNALINEANMRADSVQITLYNTSNRWHFLSFPYDVKISDIMPLYENTNWVIRKYSGASRAAQDMDKTWQNMTADSVLQAGVGYIWQSTCSKNSCGFVVPALNNAQKNLIFANDTRSIALEEHLSEFAHNRSWNLIGNPFPSFYDIRFIDFTAPITVWNDNNSTYEAYSPLDDEYILRPGEAFFVQRPVDKATIEFAPEGRQTTRLVREMPQSIVARAQGRGLQVERQVFNIELSNGEITDRTRFVLNEDASRDYDLATDAGKFMSPDASVSQLYTIENGVSLSINERPLGDGMIALGAYFGRKGSYTLSLNTRADAQVYLIDNLTGAETDLTMQDYTFNAEAGTVNDRFVIVVKKEGTTTGLSNNMSVAKVTAVSGQILVQAPQSADIAVYATDGKIVGKSQGAEASFSVRPGVYVVIINGTSYKVTVTE